MVLFFIHVIVITKLLVVGGMFLSFVITMRLVAGVAGGGILQLCDYHAVPHGCHAVHHQQDRLRHEVHPGYHRC